MANSRVGVTTSTRVTGSDRGLYISRSMMGSMKAAVLPKIILSYTLQNNLIAHFVKVSRVRGHYQFL